MTAPVLTFLFTGRDLRSQWIALKTEITHSNEFFLADRLSQQQLSCLFCVLSLKFWTDWWHLHVLQMCREFDILVCWTFIWNAIMTWNIRRIQILVPVYHKKYWWKSIGIAIGNTFLIRYCYWYWQYFLKQVLVLPILSKSIVNNAVHRFINSKQSMSAAAVFLEPKL